MAKKLKINRIIGSDLLARYYEELIVSPNEVRKFLEEANGFDIEIEIVSPGGLVHAGLEIYNLIMNYRKEYPKAEVTARIMGLAASMATIVVLAAQRIETNNAAVWMMHNAQSYASGDYRALRKASVILEHYSMMLASIYAEQGSRNKKKKPMEYCLNLMNEETYLFGKEIVDAGFADVLWGEELDKDKEEKIKEAKIQIQETKDKIQKSESAFEDFDKLVALYPENKLSLLKQTDRVITSKKGKTMSTDKNEKEMQEQKLKEAYDRGLSEGKVEGKKEIRELFGKIAPYFGDDYPKSIKDLGIKVLNEEAEYSAFVSVITMWDAQNELDKSKKARDESGRDISPNVLRNPAAGNIPGLAVTETDFQNELRRMREEEGKTDGSSK